MILFFSSLIALTQMKLLLIMLTHLILHVSGNILIVSIYVLHILRSGKEEGLDRILIVERLS